MEERLFFNGIDAATGRYLLPPMTPRQLLPLLDVPQAGWRAPRPSPILGVDPWDLAVSGWGVILPQDLDARIRDALEPLLARRRQQAGGRYQEISYASAMTLRAFLRQRGTTGGPEVPEVLPYYLLLVGEPAVVPLRFQEELAVCRAVGRLAFASVEEYARYAETVVAVETQGRQARSPRAVLFAPRHDPVTVDSADHLMLPLARHLEASSPAWSVDLRLGEAATRGRLEGCLGGEETPALLVTATHGLAAAAEEARQARWQGGLLCQDWPGIGSAPRRGDVWLGEDLPADARLGGLVSVHLASCSAVTGNCDGLASPGPDATPVTGSGNRLSALARCLLAHPGGGAQAVVGVVGRAWDGTSPLVAEQRREVFAAALTEMLHGYPVGAAMALFAARRTEMAWRLAGLLDDLQDGATVPVSERISLWMAAEASRGYLILGDPAVRVSTRER